jgi:hypothetical protein
MLEPFPDELVVPYGLVNKRTILKLPIWAAVTVLVLVIAPWPLLGRNGWPVVVVGIGLGIVIGKCAYDDPDFLWAWMGELRLKEWYD